MDQENLPVQISQSSTADGWELSKENVKPLKRGRNVQKLNETVSETMQSRQERLEDQKRAFEDSLLQATHSPDPLQIWIRYIKWAQAEYVTDKSQEVLHLLERCTSKFKAEERYKNDPRFIKLWIAYADIIPDPSEVFKFMYKNGIGKELALFYIAWAWAAESAGSYAKADKIYTTGLDRGACPLEALQKRHKEFQRRMSRMWLQKSEEHEASNPIEAEGASARAFGQDLSSSRSQQFKPRGNLLVPAGEAANRVRVSNAEVSIFCDENLPSSVQTPVLEGSNSVIWNKLGTERQRRKENTVSATSWNNPIAHTESVSDSRTVVPQASFAIFTDEGCATSESKKKEPLPSARRGLTIRQNLEGPSGANQVLKSGETKPALAERKAPKSKQVKRPSSSASAAQIVGHVSGEEEVSFEERRALKWLKKNSLARTVTLNRNSPAETLDASVASAAVLRRLSFRDDPAPAESQETVVLSQLSGTAKGQIPNTTGPQAEESEDMTINTKFAIKDLQDMFSSPSPHKADSSDIAAVKTPVVVQDTAPPTFQIFSDIKTETEPNSKPGFLSEPGQSASGTGGSLGFEIFSDSSAENEARGPRPRPRPGLRAYGHSTVDTENVRAPRNLASFNNPTLENERDIDQTSKKRQRFVREALDTYVVTRPKKASRLLVDPYNADHRKKLIEDKRVQDDVLAAETTFHFPSVSLDFGCTGSRAESIFLGSTNYAILGFLGRGSYGNVYAIRSTKGPAPVTCALKIEKKSKYLIWELHILHMLQERSSSKNEFLPRMYGLYVYRNMSALAMELGQCSLHDLINMKLKNGIKVDELLVVHFTIQMLEAVRELHRCRIIHGDVKPNNWILVTRLASNRAKTIQLKLIDFGRAIDLNCYPRGTFFKGDCHASAFKCVEMLQKKPWKYHIDVFGIAATTHCLLFGDYIELEQKNGLWSTKSIFKRYWNRPLWSTFFNKMLNLPREFDSQALLGKMSSLLSHHLEGSDAVKALEEATAMEVHRVKSLKVGAF